MDDMNALARLYPGEHRADIGQNLRQCLFHRRLGNRAQPMQGVNVVARLMVSGSPRASTSSTSVSGFSFCGNAGNIINGYLDANRPSL